MRTPKNRLQELAQNLQQRQAHKSSATQGQQMGSSQLLVKAQSFDQSQPITLQFSGQQNSSPAGQKATVEAIAFDHNEPIELRYNQETRSYEHPSPTFAAAQSVDPSLNFGSEAFEVESFDAKPATVAEPPVPVRPEVVADQNQPTPVKSATPPAQSFAVEAFPEPKPTTPQEIVTADDFLEDLNAILNGEKTFDGNSNQVVDASPRATQLSATEPSLPASPPPPEDPAKHTSPHDVFDRLAQGLSLEPAPTAVPTSTYSNAHSVFDRMGKNMAFANSFDLGTISLEQRFDEFDRILDAEEKKTSSKDLTFASGLISNKFKNETPSIDTSTKIESLKAIDDNVESLDSDAQTFSFEGELKSKAAEVDVKSIVEEYSLKANGNGRGWEGLKANYAGTTIMEMLAQYRKNLVDQRLKDAIEATSQKGLVTFGDTGSSTPTSDYDVQLYDKGILRGNPGLVIKKFYADFRTEFGMESGTLFDTNIYDPSYRMPRPEVPELKIIAEVESEVSQTAPYKHIQDAGAFAKIRKFMPEDEWRRYRNNIQISLEGCSYKELTEKALDKADLLFEEYKKQMKQQQGELPIATQDPELRAKNELYVFHLEAVQQRRSEQLKCLKEYSAATTDLEKNEAWNKLISATQELKNSMVIATLWAHEAYHSEGPMTDVVGIEQKAFEKAIVQELKYFLENNKKNQKSAWIALKHFYDKDDIKHFYKIHFNDLYREFYKDQEDEFLEEKEYNYKDSKFAKAGMNRRSLGIWPRLWSVNENFGDALKDIEHYRQLKEHTFVKTAIQTSKYVKRLLIIAETLLEGLTDEYQQLKQINEALFAQRKTEPINKALENLAAGVWEGLEKLLKVNSETGDHDKIKAYERVLTELNLHINVDVRTKLSDD